jgi:hypothetical protein
MFDICYGENYERIICPEGTLFSLNVFRDVTQPYLESAKEAGVQVAKDGKISKETRQALISRTYEKEDYLILANNHWIQSDESTTPEEIKRMKIRQRTKQMPVLIDESFLLDQTTVVEMDFPKVSYICQFQLSKNEKKLVEETDDFLPYDLRLELDADRFIEVSYGEVHKTRKRGNDDPMAGILKLIRLAVRLHEKGSRQELKV